MVGRVFWVKSAFHLLAFVNEVLIICECKTALVSHTLLEGNGSYETHSSCNTGGDMRVGNEED